MSQSLEEIWNSQIAREIRASTLAGNLHRLCRVESCPFFHRFDRKVEAFEFSPLPVEFEIDLPTQHCNIGGERPTPKNPACLMCERNWRKPEEFWQDDRLDEVCARLRPHMRHIRWLHIQGIAEPFWKERIFELLDIIGAREHQERMRISSTTNGTILTEARRRQFLQLPCSTLTWSLDAGSPEVYRVIRRVDLYDLVVENLRAYCKERGPNQNVHIHNNINTLNAGDVEPMVRLAADVGVDRLDFNPTYGVPGICVNRFNLPVFRQAQKRIMALSKRLGVYTTFMRDLTLDLELPPTQDEADMDFPG